jgi:hypothetical protein
MRKEETPAITGLPRRRSFLFAGMKEMIRRVIIVAAVAFVVCTLNTAASYGTEKGSRGGSISITSASTGDIKCTLVIRASEYLMDPGNQIRLSLEASTDTPCFKVGEGVHKRTARYDFMGVYDQRITVGEDEYVGPACMVTLDRNGMYRISAAGRFVWETDMGKVAEGFPRYYSTTVRSEPVLVTVSDLETIINGHEEKPAERENLEIRGRVLHTGEWERHRMTYNENCSAENVRGPDVFWPGEKFILAAEVTGGGANKRVRVSIQGTEYRTLLEAEGGGWGGELFETSMMDRWSGAGRKLLTFRFVAESDGAEAEDTVTVVIDDTDDYWRMHRKE